MSEEHGPGLREKLNTETARISWQELQRYFARGVVIVVGERLDLVDIAVSIAEDNSGELGPWLESGQIHRATDDEAKRWLADDAALWAVVTAPWVLVQEEANKPE